MTNETDIIEESIVAERSRISRVQHVGKFLACGGLNTIGATAYLQADSCVVATSDLVFLLFLLFFFLLFSIFLLLSFDTPIRKAFNFFPSRNATISFIHGLSLYIFLINNKLKMLLMDKARLVYHYFIGYWSNIEISFFC